MELWRGSAKTFRFWLFCIDLVANLIIIIIIIIIVIVIIIIIIIKQQQQEILKQNCNDLFTSIWTELSIV